MAKTKIEWADRVWNPITGCSAVSEGCQNCYARRMANRLRGRYGYPNDEPFRVTFHPERLEEPLRWRKPSRIFVCSMGDLFHLDLSWAKVHQIINLIEKASWHTFLILTKRPTLMKEYFSYRIPMEIIKNLWLGVSVENQRTADERIQILLQIPAAHYFISHEPALGMITYPKEFLALVGNGWLITGGETGPKARPMHPDIPCHDRDQCHAAGMPFFFKQWGGWTIDYEHPTHIIMRNGTWERINQANCCSGVAIAKIGKKKAGRILDGRIWEERPE